MDEFDQQLLAGNTLWQQLLQTYLDLTTEASARPADEFGARWADRLESLDDVAPAELSRTHGQLIALGWLKFQFEMGQSGLMYRVSSEGRLMLSRLAGQPVAKASSEVMAPEELAA